MSDIVEQALRVLSEHVDIGDKCSCGFLDVGNMEHHQAQALADAGLLADRATPTREQIAEAVAPIAFNAANYPKPGESTTPFVTKIADAVLALIADQPTVNEVKAQAWDECAQWHAEQGMPVNGAATEHNPYRAQQIRQQNH